MFSACWAKRSKKPCSRGRIRCKSPFMAYDSPLKESAVRGGKSLAEERGWRQGKRAFLRCGCSKPAITEEGPWLGVFHGVSGRRYLGSQEGKELELQPAAKAQRRRRHTRKPLGRQWRLVD